MTTHERKRDLILKWLLGISGPVISLILALIFALLVAAWSRGSKEHVEIKARLQAIEKSCK